MPAGAAANQSADSPAFETPRLKELNVIIARQPENAWELANRAHVYMLLGENRLARADLDRALKIGGSGPFHSRIAWTFYNLGEYETALAEWKLAAEKSRFANTFDYYALALGHWGVKDLKGAMEAYDKTVKAHPEFATLAGLEKRIEYWSSREKEDIRAVFLLWHRAYVEKASKAPQ